MTSPSFLAMAAFGKIPSVFCKCKDKLISEQSHHEQSICKQSGFQAKAAKNKVVPGPGEILLTEKLSCPHSPCDYAQLPLHRDFPRSSCHSFEQMWLRHQDAATIKQSTCHNCPERLLVLLKPCSSKAIWQCQHLHPVAQQICSRSNKSSSSHYVQRHSLCLVPSLSGRHYIRSAVGSRHRVISRSIPVLCTYAMFCDGKACSIVPRMHNEPHVRPTCRQAVRRTVEINWRW